MNISPGSTHPGKPVPWPQGKSSSASQQSQVQQAQTTQTTGGVKSGAPASTAPSSQAAASEAINQIAKSVKSSGKSAPNISRALTMSDIKAHLHSLGIPDTDFNTKLASTMLRNGMELSSANFVRLLQMLSGTDKSMNMQQAAILLAMKGMDAPKALQTLADYFAQNPQMAQQFNSLQASLANLGSAMGIAKGMLSPTLVAQLGALLGQFEDMLKNLSSNYQFSGNNSVTSEKMLGDLRAMKSLLEGVQGKLPQSNSAESQVLTSSLSEAMAKANQAIEGMLAQGILSQKGRSEVNYLYQQIPNMAGDPKKNTEIVIKRDGKGKNSKIDHENTQVVLSMNTTNLGKMVCSVIVKGKRVYVIFIFNKKEYGDDARDLISKEFMDLQKKLVAKDYVVSGYQVKVDPAMCSVKPYLIPIIPNLEQQLRRIDLET